MAACYPDRAANHRPVRLAGPPMGAAAVLLYSRGYSSGVFLQGILEVGRASTSRPPRMSDDTQTTRAAHHRHDLRQLCGAQRARPRQGRPASTRPAVNFATEKATVDLRPRRGLAGRPRRARSRGRLRRRDRAGDAADPRHDLRELRQPRGEGPAQAARRPQRDVNLATEKATVAVHARPGELPGPGRGRARRRLRRRRAGGAGTGRRRASRRRRTPKRRPAPPPTAPCGARSSSASSSASSSSPARCRRTGSRSCPTG